MGFRTVLIAALLLGAAVCDTAAQQSLFVGTWESVPGLDAQGNPSQGRDALLIVSADGFFTFSVIPPGRPKVDKPMDQMTREELAARFTGLQVIRGTYSVSGNTFTRIELGHSNPRREGRTVTAPFRLEGDTLVLLNADPQDKSEFRFRRAKTATAMAQQKAEPFTAVGTWKLNPAKSTGSGNQLKARSRIHIVESRGGGVIVNRIEQINADGSTSTGYFTGKADGTPYPMITIRSNGPAQVGSMTETRVDAYTIRWIIKDADGKMTAEGTRTVASDGKSYRLVNANGDLVYDRQ